MVHTKMPLQSAQTTGNGSVHDCRGDAAQTTFYVVPAGTIAGGTVQLETSYSSSYSGTWAPLTALITLVTDTQVIVSYTAPLAFVRARIVTNVSGSGGSVSVYLLRSA